MNMRMMRYFLIVGALLAGALGQHALGQPAGQEVKWLMVGSLRNWISSVGAEIEIGRTGLANEQIDGLIWPAQFTRQNHQVGKTLWLGTTNYYDRILKTTIPAKVVSVGPRTADPITEVMPVRFKMYGRFLAPNVVVDGEAATDNAARDGVDSVIESLPCDRLVESVLNTTIGVTITRKVMAFTQQNHDNYYITEYILTNTGLIDKEGLQVETKTLTGVFLGLKYRYGFGEEGYRQNPPTPLNNIGWGRNAVHQVIGTNPSAAGFEFPAHYAWYGRHSQSSVDDIGLPAYWVGGDGHLTAAQHAGVVTLHADRSSQDSTNDPAQPVSTPYLGADDQADAPQANNQYNQELMQRKYNVMTSGHPAQTQADLVGDATADNWGNNPGGYEQVDAYGPYTLAPGENVRIVVAEGVNGLGREQCYEIGGQWIDQTLTTFTLPDGSTTPDRNAYKKAWVKTGVDSILTTFRRAAGNFAGNYVIPQPPTPPASFIVQSGGDRIRLSWTPEAESSPGFDGYEVYRAIGRPDTFYTRIFSCTRSNLANAYDDTSARRGFDYYYYIVSKDDGTRNDAHPGVPLVSSKFYTLTNKPAYLRRPASSDMSDIRVVPNPYDARSVTLQFGTSTPDRIAFFGLPPVCTIKIYTERGDLVRTLEHSDGSGDELWDQTTTYRQIIVSGIYLAVFVTPDGKSVVRKFIVIR